MEEIRDEISVASVESMLKDVSNLVESMLYRVKRFYHPFEEPAIKAFRDQLQQCITKVVDDFTVKCVKSCPETIIIDDDDIKEEVTSESVYDDPPNDHPMINLIDENEDNRDETQKTLEEELLMAEPSSSVILCNEITAVHKEITDNDNIIAILLDYHNDTDVQNEALDENILSDRDYPVVDDSNNDTSELNGEESQMQEPAKVISSSDHSNIHSGGKEFVLSHDNNNVQFDPLMEHQTEVEIEDETLISEIPIQEEVLTSAIESMSNTSSVNNAESTVNMHAMEDVSSSNQDNAVDKPQQLRNRTSKRKKVEADNVCVAHKLRKRTLKQKKMADDESKDDSNANTSFEIVIINKSEAKIKMNVSRLDDLLTNGESCSSPSFELQGIKWKVCIKVRTVMADMKYLALYLVSCENDSFKKFDCRADLIMTVLSHRKSVENMTKKLSCIFREKESFGSHRILSHKQLQESSLSDYIKNDTVRLCLHAKNVELCSKTEPAGC